jgi:hypothetical protein
VSLLTPRVPPPQVVIIDSFYISVLERAAEMARKRSQSPAETLSAALDALAPATGGTPREHAAKCADDFGDEHLGSTACTNGIEAAIRAAAQPLVDALRAIADQPREHDGSPVARAALAAWEGK